jgi:hypothetical protein
MLFCAVLSCHHIIRNRMFVSLRSAPENLKHSSNCIEDWTEDLGERASSALHFLFAHLRKLVQTLKVIELSVFKIPTGNNGSL